MMEHRLIRLHGTEDWEAWGDDWPRHVDVVGDRSWTQSWYGPGPEVAAKSPRRLDWGAVLYEVSKADIERLAWEPAWLANTDSARAERRLVEGLSDDDRYGVIFIEMY